MSPTETPQSRLHNDLARFINVFPPNEPPSYSVVMLFLNAYYLRTKRDFEQRRNELDLELKCLPNTMTDAAHNLSNFGSLIRRDAKESLPPAWPTPALNFSARPMAVSVTSHTAS